MVGVGVVIYVCIWKRRGGEEERKKKKGGEEMKDLFDDLLSYVPREGEGGKMEEVKPDWMISPDLSFSSDLSVSGQSGSGSEERETEEEEEGDGRGVDNHDGMQMEVLLHLRMI